MKIFYFTATGNSLWTAKNLSENIESIAQIDFHNGYTAKDDEAIGIICPTYGFTPPYLVQEFMKKTIFETPYLFVIATYGDRLGGFPKTVQNLFRDKRGPDYIGSLKMVDNAAHAGYEMQDQKETLPEKQVETHFATIKEDIENRVSFLTPNTNPFLTALVYGSEPFTKGMRGNKVLSVDTDSCVQCGICTKVCPAHNIQITEQVDIGMNCELCLACLHNCPKQAIHIRREKSGERYRHEEITLAEIIKANNQA